MNVHHPDIHHAGILRDNDGDPDLFLTFYGRPNALYRNEAGGHFVEVAARAGLASPPAGRKGPNWTTSAAFLDYAIMW
jgi:enediyne biosynthesis protein E4